MPNPTRKKETPQGPDSNQPLAAFFRPCQPAGGAEHIDVVLRSTDFPNMKFNQFLMASYFGPGLLPHAQKLWIDELAVSTRRIGPLELPK